MEKTLLLPTRPLSRADMAAAELILPRSTSSAISDRLRSLWGRAVTYGEWFDFGTIRRRRIIDGGYAQGDVADLLLAGLMNPPYADAVFRVRIKADEEPVVPTKDWRPIVDSEVVMTIRQDEKGGAIELSFWEAVGYRSERLYQNGYALIGQGPCAEHFDLKGREADSSSVRWVYAYLWTMLNTSNIEKVVEVPSEKLNRARLKSGKELLRPVTKVNAAQYEIALTETERMERGGDGGSPRMHLRRGHLRRYKNERFSEAMRGAPQWIAPVIVNGEAGGDRTGYRVVVK